jgi:IS5 family transposase
MLALIKQQRCGRAKQFKRAKKCLRRLKTYLGRVMRDIRRKIARDEGLKALFAQPLSLSWRVLTQKRCRDAPNVYARSGMHWQGQGAQAL